MLRTSSVEEQLCKPKGKYIWNKFTSFSTVTLYLHQYNGEEAGHCAKNYFVSDEIKSAALNPKRRQLPGTLSGLRTTTAIFLQIPTLTAVSSFLLQFKEGSENI